MKKILALVLALTLVLGMATIASAAETKDFANASGDYTFTNKTDATNTPDYTATGNVNVTVTTTTINPVYYVVVEWGDLNFTYTFDNGKIQWNPLDHTYEEKTGAVSGWDKETESITVTNHTNAAIKVSAAVNGAEWNGVTASINGTERTLPSADGKAIDAAELTTTFTVSVTGVPVSSAAVTSQTIDTVTVTIKAS